MSIPYYAKHETGLIFGFFGNFRFLSNFYILDNGVCLDELYYPSVENAYQAAKWPLDQREQFLTISPGIAKQKGKEAPNFNGKKWNKNKVTLMRNLVSQKFKNNVELKNKLILLEGYEIKEANNWGDVFWGVNENDEGENILGQILMDVRDFYIEEKKKLDKFLKKDIKNGK